MKSGRYKKYKLATDPNYRARTNYRNLTKKFWKSDSEDVSMYRLVSKDPFNFWISYQQQPNNAPDDYHLDERWPQSKFDLNNHYHCLFATNVINFAPMDPIENIKKSNKIIPELLVEQIGIAERFLADIELPEEERRMFAYLLLVYTCFINDQVLGVLKNGGILV